MSQVVSQIEKHFITNNVYKRSRRHFDISRLNRYEQQLQLSRRTPSHNNETISSRVGESFVSSRQILSDKVNTDISLYHKINHQVETEATESTSSPQKLCKTVDMRKMLAREYFERKKPYHINEDQFIPPAPHSARMRQSYDFEKHLPRRDHSEYRASQLSPDPQKPGKIREHILYDQGNFSCLVDYKKYGKSSSKKQEDSMPMYDPERVRRGEQLARKAQLIGQRQFYNGNGKNDPSQLDNKIMKDNEYFWRSVRQERRKFKDFSVEKRKQDERKRRLDEISGRKRVPDERGEMCDGRYFMRLDCHNN